MATWLSVFVGIVAGGIITFSVSRHYYVKAAKELTKETQKLRHQTTLILRGLEDAGLVKLNWSAQREIVGLVIDLSGTASGASNAAGDLTVLPSNEVEDDQ